MTSRFWRRVAPVLACALGSTGSLRAYDFIGSAWPAGDIVMHLQLGPAATPLTDGAPDWATVAESALNDWNEYLTRSHFTAVRDSTAVVRNNNQINNVVFRADIYGEEFGTRTLAITLTSARSGRTSEQDVLFNSNRTWDSYRGNLRGNVMDFRRVALHEFGHVLGLDHPDKATPAQNVSSIMNSTISNVETLRPDDIAGARILYDANSGVAPAIAAQPQPGSVQVGGSYTMSVLATGSGPFIYNWSFRPAGTTKSERFALATGPSYTIGSVQLGDAGTYSVVVNSPSGGLVASNNAALTVAPVTTSTDTTLANISTRGVVGTGSSVLIAGFVIGGTTPKDIFVRAAGPALTDFGVPGTLVDPTLSILNQSGQVVAQNDNWDSAGNAVAVSAAASRLGAFQFKAGSRDSAVLATLPPGNYSAVVSGVNNTTGVALVEAYDADSDAAVGRTRKLVNIATRGQVGAGSNVLIAGLVVAGPGPRTYLIRAIGPTLAKAPFNVSGALKDPFLQIYQGETLLRENDDWDSSASAQPGLREASTRVGAFAMMETRDVATESGLDSAMLITLQPGSYTAKVSGFDGATGVALVEVYELP
jgi:hypothetical protein